MQKGEKSNMRANQDIRAKIKEAGLTMWGVSLELGVSESTLVRWLRVEVEGEKKERILEAIKQRKEKIEA